MVFARAALLVVLGSLAACSSGPDEEAAVLDVFDYLRALRARWDDAYQDRDEDRLNAVVVDLKRVVGANFERILRQLSSSDPQNQKSAAFALGFSARPGAIPGLVAATESPDWELRHFAVSALGMLGLKEVPTEPFRRLLDDRSANVRLAALHGLRQLVDRDQDRGLLEAIHARLGDAEMGVRNEALLVLRKIGKGESVKAIVDRGVRDPDELVRANAALTLGVIGKDAISATPFLIELLRDEKSKVVESAWLALKAIHDKDFDRSYHNWRDWYEEELRNYYSCEEHKDVMMSAPGECPVCKKKLERYSKDAPRKTEAPPPGLYACPEHPEIRTTTPSHCGKAGCGKALVPRKPDPVTYVCPDHPEILTGSPSVCGKAGCGKALVPKPQ